MRRVDPDAPGGNARASVPGRRARWMGIGMGMGPRARRRSAPARLVAAGDEVLDLLDDPAALVAGRIAALVQGISRPTEQVVSPGKAGRACVPEGAPPGVEQVAPLVRRLVECVADAVLRAVDHGGASFGGSVAAQR